MALFGFGKKESKPRRRATGDRLMQAGAREYEAKRQDRLAERLDAEGDAAGAQAARDEAVALRTPRR